METCPIHQHVRVAGSTKHRCCLQILASQLPLSDNVIVLVKWLLINPLIQHCLDAFLVSHLQNKQQLHASSTESLDTAAILMYPEHVARLCRRPRLCVVCERTDAMSPDLIVQQDRSSNKTGAAPEHQEWSLTYEGSWLGWGTCAMGGLSMVVAHLTHLHCTLHYI